MSPKLSDTVPHIKGIREPHPPDPVQLGVSYPMRPWLAKLWREANDVPEVRE